jgi:CHASE3 domain sensor protein
MSRATAAPSATAGTPVVARTGVGSVAASAPVASRSRSALNGALEGTPGRMRVLAFVAAVVAAAFGLVGAMSLWSSAGALERADHNTAQVVRIQGIYADLVRADADATSSFLVGGIEDPVQRADYDASLDRVARGIADAADAQPADSEALGALNAAVQDYAATIEEARVYNRQGLPVGSQYLSNGSDSLRAQILPIVSALIAANTARANAEFDASSRLPIILLGGLAALAVLVLIMVWLARRTHRYLNPSMFVGSLVVVLAIAIGAVTLGGVGGQVRDVRDTDFAYTVKLADARSAAFDAKSNESLTLIKRGSGGTYEDAWQKQSANILTLLSGLDSRTGVSLQASWKTYADAHKAIRDLDNAGNWDGAVQKALDTAPGSANAAFAAFDTQSSQRLDQYKNDTSSGLVGPVTWVTILGWVLLVLCAGAAILMLRGMSQRIEEYR